MAWILVCSKCDRERLRQHDPKEVSGCCGAPLVIADRNDRAGLRRGEHPAPEPRYRVEQRPQTDWRGPWWVVCEDGRDIIHAATEQSAKMYADALNEGDR